ncbi:hypothetical protein OsI_33305 [Oryza sativa Indica Group]|uniref:Uncharacterized protein n=1 Tax=Oryza sativa subsp. indica TaxID=39946 RepID=B8BGI8_ORYSI|nr:hypothetical protein OsI_33305 [Oryza sativa Indica Group]
MRPPAQGRCEILIHELGDTSIDAQVLFTSSRSFPMSRCHHAAWVAPPRFDLELCRSQKPIVSDGVILSSMELANEPEIGAELPPLSLSLPSNSPHRHRLALQSPATLQSRPPPTAIEVSHSHRSRAHSSAFLPA